VVASQEVEDIVALLPDRVDLPPLEYQNYSTIASFEMTIDMAFELVKHLSGVVASPDVAGVVIAQGTDTMEEASFLADLLIPPGKPVVFTGAQLAPVPRHHFRLGLIIAVVDCVNAEFQKQSSEWTAQVTAADRLVMSKTDLVDLEACVFLQKELRKMNHAAPIVQAADVHADDFQLLGSGLHDSSPETEARHWIDQIDSEPVKAFGDEATPSHPHHAHLEDGVVKSFCLLFDEQINWVGFGLWLSMLLNRYGTDILRVKGILNIAETEHPVAIHGVQHLVHPPVHLTAWPDTDRRSRVIFIVRNLSREMVERSFQTFCKGLK